MRPGPFIAGIGCVILGIVLLWKAPWFARANLKGFDDMAPGVEDLDTFVGKQVRQVRKNSTPLRFRVVGAVLFPISVVFFVEAFTM